MVLTSYVPFSLESAGHLFGGQGCQGVRKQLFVLVC